MYFTKDQIRVFVEKVGQPKASVILNRFFNQYRKKMNSSDVESLYDDDYLEKLGKHETYCIVNDRYKLHIYNHFAFEYIRKKITKETAVLDIGCGDGEFALAIASQGVGYVAGIDFSIKSIDQAKSKLANAPMDNCTFLFGDVKSLHEKKLEKFDFIVLSDVTEHLSDNELSNLFDQIENVLAPSGEIVIHTPNGLALCNTTDSSLFQVLYISYLKLFYGYKGFERSIEHLYHDQMHINIKSYRELADLLKGFGYKTRVMYDETRKFFLLNQLSSSMLVIAKINK